MAGETSHDLEEVGVETWTVAPKRPKAENREPCLVHIYPTGPSMAMRYTLGQCSTIAIGRGSDCDICINDAAVSRRHAQIQPEGQGFCLVDLGSTNGSFVNNFRVTKEVLKDGDYIRVGKCIFRYLASGNVEAEYHEEIYRLTIIDALTEVHNKRFLLEFINRELVRSFRYNRPLALIMLDVDRFKLINDQMGHLAGDFTLRELALKVKEVTRKEALFARYGGEEFVMALPEISPENALLVAERTRALIEKHQFQYEGKFFPVTISLGVACTLGNESIVAEQLIERADKLLYQAKREGRNRVAFDQTLPVISKVGSN